MKVEKKINERENNTQIERVILVIYGIYTIAMATMSILSGWGIWIPYTILIGLALCIYMHFQKVKTYWFRAVFTVVMAWMNLIIYGVNLQDFFSLSSPILCLVILLGIYCIPKTVYIAVGATTFLLLYHGLILRTIHISADAQGVEIILQILAVYLGEYVAYYLIKVQVESNKALLKTIENLETAEQSKDDFMANISHEIRTPINTISGMSEMVLQENLPDKARADIFDIQTAGRNLLSIVSDILDFSELESGKMELVEEPYNITSTINDIMNMTIARKNGKNLELIVDCDASIPNSLMGDEQKIRRAVMNVVDNAIKFTKEGGVVLVVTARKEDYGVNLIITVKDTGIGMDAENLEKLFTSFTQVDAKRNRQEGGIGLGLAIAQAIVNKMGGFINIKSAPEKGSEVQIVVPQKVLDDKPIVSVKHPDKIRVAAYIDMEKYKYALIRDSYVDSIHHMVEQLEIGYHQCRNLPELKRRMEKEKFTHVIVGWAEYCEDKTWFEELSHQMKVILIREREDEESIGSRMLHIYKPFYVLSLASVLNGENVIQSTDGSHYQNRRFIAPDASVLVVDDNIMNLRVVEGLLRPYKMKVFVAGSGKEALKKVESMEFDFIFMDHMMPEMDGVETFHRIRQKPGKYFKDVPIIALTANAIGGAREMFLAEGFADFVAKPIEVSVLERVLRRHIPEEKIIRIEDVDLLESVTDYGQQESTASVKQEEKKKKETPNKKSGNDLAMEGIDTTLGLSYSGGEENDYIEIVQVYYKSGVKKVQDIRTAYADRDWKNYVILVHSVKSRSMGIGAVALSDMAKELEAAGKAEKEKIILEKTDAMLTEYERVLSVIAANKTIFPEGVEEDKVLQKADGQSPLAETAADAAGEAKQAKKQEISVQETAEKLAELMEKIQTFERDDVEAVLQELSGCRCGQTDMEELLKPIKDKVDMFDFMGAEEELQTIREKVGEEL